MKIPFLIILPLFFGCSSTKNSAETNDFSDSNYKIVDAKVISEQFVNKGGKEIKGVFDCFLEYEGKSMFIKFMDSKVSFEEIEPLIGKTATFKISELEGLWDTNDNNIQSRIGKYVVIWSIEE